MNWLFLRGLVRDQSHWESFPKNFEAALPGEKVFLLDHVGIGTERGRKPPLSVSGMVDDLRARWLKLDSSKPWGILAASLGGMCVMDWQSRFPDDFKVGVIINSSASNLNSLFERMYPRNYSIVPKVLLGRPGPIELERTILEMTCQNASNILKALERRTLDFEQNPESFLPLFEFQKIALAQIAAASTFRAPERLKAKNLVLLSNGDTLVSPECSRRLAQYIQAEVREHSWGGHDLPLDDPDWIFEQVRSFIAAN